MAPCLAIRQVQLQELALRSKYDVTRSIFPLVEAWLDIPDHVNALLYVASRKSAKNYRSIGDWMYCETFPQMQASCQRFYDDKGPCLKDIISEPRRKFEQRILLHVLWVAYNAHVAQRKMSWARTRKEALDYFGS